MTHVILLVEDNVADIVLMRRAAVKNKHDIQIETVSDGEKALAYLRREEPYTNAPPPNIVLLDINLPGRSGREILEEIKADAKLRHVPVVILTSSNLPEDIDGMYSRYASSYMVKPATPSAFNDMLNSFSKYWFDTVSLPGSP